MLIQFWEVVYKQINLQKVFGATNSYNKTFKVFGFVLKCSGQIELLDASSTSFPQTPHLISFFLAQNTHDK